MGKILQLLIVASLVSACSSPGFRRGHSHEPIDLGGGQFIVEGYRLETGLERAREKCGPKEMVTLNIIRPVKQFEWMKITFICR